MLVDELLKQINCAASMLIATSLNFSLSPRRPARGHAEEHALCGHPNRNSKP
jgi:hypothetical protein